MQALVVLVLLAITSPLYVVALNKYPIVLVHGFGGWGRDEGLGLRYWGGIQGDIQEHLEAQGYTVFTAVVGPFSSNWDRACELYAQIKGGQVDYGKNHSATHGHKRFGSTFPGLYPTWGDVVDGHVNKIHLIGHSMGGLTARMLAQLLAKGSEGAPSVESPSSHTLFAGGKDWVHSITTISSPNQGTLLSDVVTDSALIKTFTLGIFTTLGVLGAAGMDVIYNAKLDQWGLAPRQHGESLPTYIDRIYSSSIFQPGFRDISLWSLSHAGAAEENQWVKTLPNIYYFSFATSDTFSWRDWMLRSIELPNLFTMFLPLQPFSTLLGSRYPVDHGLSEKWQLNDGLVNTISMSKDATGEAVAFNGIAQRGKWNVMDALTRLDHVAVIGITLHTQIRGLYAAHAQLLTSLPTGETLLFGSMPQLNAHLKVSSVIANLTATAANVNSKKDLKKLCAQPINTFAANYCTNMLNQPKVSELLNV